jgi:hypothetical protein
MLHGSQISLLYLCATTSSGGIYMNESFTVEEIAELIRDEGYKALVTIDEDEDAFIASASDGTDWYVLMHGFAPFFDSISFRCLLFSETDPVEDCNKFNNDYRFLKLYRVVDEGAVKGKYFARAEMDCDFAGGVSELMVSATIRRWIACLPIAEDAIYGKLSSRLESENQ